MIPITAKARKVGLYGVIVECTRSGCRNSRKLSFDDLSLPDDVMFVDITNHRDFRCHNCVGRSVHAIANHPAPIGRRPT